MHEQYQDRMADTQRRGPGRPRKNPPIVPETEDVVLRSVRCPHCDHTVWKTVSGGNRGVGDTYKRCQSCGNIYVFQSDGMLRRSG